MSLLVRVVDVMVLLLLLVLPGVLMMLCVISMLRAVMPMVRVLQVGGVSPCGAAGVEDGWSGGSGCGWALGLV